MLTASAGDGLKTMKGVTMNSAKMPKTVRELGEMAEEQGITAAELLGKLEPIPTQDTGDAVGEGKSL